MYRFPLRFALRALPLAALWLTACDSIGDGLTVEKLELVPASTTLQTQGHETGNAVKLFECLRAELLAVGTFTDGARANFNSRARFSSSHPDIVAVSNDDVPLELVISGRFQNFGGLTYARGTVFPLQATETPVTISAEFVGLRATVDVIVRTPQFQLVPVPTPDPLAPPATSVFGRGAEQRFTVLGDFDGRRLTSTDFSLSRAALNVFTLNPILFRAENGVFVGQDDDGSTEDFDRYVVPDAASPAIAVHTLTGDVDGLASGPTPWTITARTGLCADRTEPHLVPSAEVRVAEFTSVDPLVLEYEPDMGANGFVDGDIVIGTDHRPRITGHLDLDGDPTTAEATQDLTTQVEFDFEPKDIGCDDDGLNCLANGTFFHSLGSSRIDTSTTSTGGDATVRACFPDCTLDADDADDFVLESGTLPIRAVLAEICDVRVEPDTLTTQAFTFPAPTFRAVGTFIARLSGDEANTEDCETDPVIGELDISRKSDWLARPEPDSTLASEFVSVRRTISSFGTFGQVIFSRNVEEDTEATIEARPFPILGAVDPGQATLTVTRCPDADCLP